MREKYESLSLAVLKELAKARGLKGISTLRKGQLIEVMLKQDEKDKAAAEQKAAMESDASFGSRDVVPETMEEPGKRRGRKKKAGDSDVAVASLEESAGKQEEADDHKPDGMEMGTGRISAERFPETVNAAGEDARGQARKEPQESQGVRNQGSNGLPDGAGAAGEDASETSDVTEASTDFSGDSSRNAQEAGRTEQRYYRNTRSPGYYDDQGRNSQRRRRTSDSPSRSSYDYNSQERRTTYDRSRTRADQSQTSDYRRSYNSQNGGNDNHRNYGSQNGSADYRRNYGSSYTGGENRRSYSNSYAGGENRRSYSDSYGGTENRRGYGDQNGISENRRNYGDPYAGAENRLGYDDQNGMPETERDYGESNAGTDSRPADGSQNMTVTIPPSYDASNEDVDSPNLYAEQNRTSDSLESYAEQNYVSENRKIYPETGYTSAPETSVAPSQSTVDVDRPPAELSQLDSGQSVSGILEVMPDGYGFIRSDNYLPGENDVYVSPSQIRRFNLKTGDIISGNTRIKSQQEKFSALLYLKKINDLVPSEAMRRYNFEDMTPIFPNERLRLERDPRATAMRIVDLFSPIGKGQRGMIVSPPKAGKTTLLKDIARSLLANSPGMRILILLIDERPEEVTDIKEAIRGENVEVIYSTFDETPEHHKRVSEMVIERAKRLVEQKQDVTILLDSITRLARAYNLTVPPSGRTLSGGLDPAALHMPKRFFGAARNMREGGSLTILATALVDTGSKMDDVVYEEFKGTGNMELVLDRKLSEKRVFPAIDIPKSGTRREDLLLDREEQEAIYIMRRALNGMKSDEAVENIMNMFIHTKDNRELVQRVRRQKFI